MNAAHILSRLANRLRRLRARVRSDADRQKTLEKEIAIFHGKISAAELQLTTITNPEATKALEYDLSYWKN